MLHSSFPRLSLVAASRSYALISVLGLLIAVVSFAVEHSLQAHRRQQLWHEGSILAARGLSRCGPLAQLPCGMWDLPRPGIELVSLALQGGFLTTGPPGNP